MIHLIHLIPIKPFLQLTVTVWHAIRLTLEFLIDLLSDHMIVFM